MEDQIVKVGDIVEIRTSNDTIDSFNNATSLIVGKVHSISSCKPKKGSSYKYKIRLINVNGEDIVSSTTDESLFWETRLKHLSWKVLIPGITIGIKNKKRKSDIESNDLTYNTNGYEENDPMKTEKKHNKKKKSRQLDLENNVNDHNENFPVKTIKLDSSTSLGSSPQSNVVVNKSKKSKGPNIPYFSIPLHPAPRALNYIVAPMVGGSELAFRVLCRRYGATLAYTPMMHSDRFAVDEAYRRDEFQTIAPNNSDNNSEVDRPLVAHFCANNPNTFLKAAKYVESMCDAIDLNLGCPQRIAYSGHFGSYLLDEEDRSLILDIVKTVSSGISIPLFVKIRLLDKVEDTIRLCQQLVEAGAALIAIHGRYRVNLVGRSGPGARDGAAHLDQIAEVRKHIPKRIPIICNGNVITWEDVIKNKSDTSTQGVMSAEGLLDNPALFNNGVAVDKLQLGKEYLELAEKYPVKMKSIIFHIRRMCREALVKYQLLEDCLNATELSHVKTIIMKAIEYQNKPSLFSFDAMKEKRAKEALERKKREEGKRKEYENRMIRKAKREGKDLHYYLKHGSQVPSFDDIARLKSIDKDEAFNFWKSNYSQHCYSYHFEEGGCKRDRTCAFLHADTRLVNEEAVAYG
eukprot:gene5647-7798_t